MPPRPDAPHEPMPTQVTSNHVGQSVDGRGDIEIGRDSSDTHRALRTRLAELERELADSERLRRDAVARSTVDSRLVDCARDGGGLAALVRECARLTGKAVTLFDHSGRRTTTAHASTSPVPTPPLDDILAALEHPAAVDDRVHYSPATLGGRLSRRRLVASVHADREQFGWLVIDEHPGGFAPVDEYATARTAQLLAHEYFVQKRVARVAWNSRSALTRQLVRGTSFSADLAASADYLGVNIRTARVVVYVRDAGDNTTADGVDRQLAMHVERSMNAEVLATRGSDGLMLLVEAADHFGALTTVARVKSAMLAAVSELPALTAAIVGVSSVCNSDSLARGYREAREVVLCIDHFARLSARVLAVDDLGPARLFLANSSTTAVTHYVDDVLGALLTGVTGSTAGVTGSTDLLSTLQHYFDANRSVRTTASRLGMHENTIRLRLARVHSLTGLDVAADATDQLSVQTALLLLRLQGHPALAPFETREDTQDTGRKLA